MDSGKAFFFGHQFQFLSRQNWPFLAAFLTLPEMRGGLPKLRGGKGIVMKSLAWYMCNDWWPSKRLGCLVKPIKKFFFICGNLFWESWCEHDDQSASPSSLYCLVFLSSQRSNQRSKKRKTFKISLRIHPAYFPTARLTASATKRWICVVDVVAKAREIEEEEKIFSANHSKLKLNKILEDLFYITAHNLRTLQLRREQFHRSRKPTMAAWVNHPQIFTWLYK